MQSTVLLTGLSPEKVKELTKEVKETLAFGYNKNLNRGFSAADLWNIQRQRKSLSTRRGFGF